jgi:hypothetical protein
VNTKRVFLLLLMSLFINGCASTIKRPNMEDPNILQAVRDCVIKHVSVSDTDKKTILEKRPSSVRMYIMAGTFGQFGWAWKLPSHREICVDFTGDINNIDCDRFRFILSAVEIPKKK